MATWREEITKALQDHGETWEDIESITLTDKQLDRKFGAGYGSTESAPFTAWTAKRIYFPWCYDDAEGATSVSRHPDGIATYHVGGG